MSQEQFWRDFVYIQRDVEDKEQFAKNWDLIFGKKEKNHATKEGLQPENNQQEHLNRDEETS